MRNRWLLTAAILIVASAMSSTLLTSESVFHSQARAPLSAFVQPGVTVWWFALGGPFRTAPASATGIAFAALANGLCWLIALWLVVAVARLVRRAWPASTP